MPRPDASRYLFRRTRATGQTRQPIGFQLIREQRRLEYPGGSTPFATNKAAAGAAIGDWSPLP